MPYNESKYTPTLEYQIKILKAIKKGKCVEYFHLGKWESWNNNNHFPDFVHHYFRITETNSNNNSEKSTNKKFGKACSAIRKYLLDRDWEEIPLFSHKDEKVNGWVCGYMVDPFTGLAHRVDCAFMIESDRELVIKLNEKYSKTQP